MIRRTKRCEPVPASTDLSALLLEHHEDIVVLFDSSTGCIRTASPSWYRLCGDDADDLVHAADGADRDAVARAVAQADPTTIRVRFGHRTGRSSLMDLRVVPAGAPDGSMIAVLTDVTEIDAKDKELRNTRLVEHALLDATDTMLAVVDSRGTVLAANESWRRSAAEAGPVATPIGENAVEPRDGYREQSQELRSELLDVLLGRKTRTRVAVTGHDDSRFDARIRPVVIGAVRAVVSVTDVSESTRLQAEIDAQARRRASIIDSIPVGLAHVDRDLVFAEANPALRQLVGADPVGRRLPSVVHADDVDVVIVGAAAVGTETERFDHEVTVTDGAGQPRLCRITIVPADPGHSHHLLVLLEDVAGLREMERALDEQHRFAALGELAAGVAADVHSPLQAIQHNLEFLTSLEPSTDAQAALTESITALGQIEQTVRALATHAVSHTDDLVLTDLGEIIDACVRLAAASVPEGTSVHVSGDPLPLVRCVGPQLGQALLAIVDNGVRAVAETNRDDGEIRVDHRVVGDGIELTVRDNGVGMSDAARSRAFDRFFTTRPAGGGAGLGLSLARSIVEGSHGGAIDLQAAPGGGTIVRVRVPTDGGGLPRAMCHQRKELP